MIASVGFGAQLGLNVLSAIFAAVFGGIAATLIVQSAQHRRDALDLRRRLSVEMLEAAYGYYRRSEEEFRVRRSGEGSPVEDLPSAYEKFRTTAAVIESRLTVYFSDQTARWMWHAVIDLLSVRHYRLMGWPTRFDELIGRHAVHPREVDRIPEPARRLFLDADQLRDYDTVWEQFPVTLNAAVSEVAGRGQRERRFGRRSSLRNKIIYPNPGIDR